MEVLIDVYTDGACSGNPGIGAWAFLILIWAYPKTHSRTKQQDLRDRQGVKLARDSDEHFQQAEQLSFWNSPEQNHSPELEFLKIPQDSAGKPYCLWQYSDCGAKSYTTNNQMELQAVYQAIDYVKSFFECCLLQGQEQFIQLRSCQLTSDSVYVQKGFSQWRWKWEQNQFRNAQGQPIKNQELWKSLFQLIQGLDIQWKWVKGHSGHIYNEYCDQLAQNQIRSMKKFV